MSHLRLFYSIPFTLSAFMVAACQQPGRYDESKAATAGGSLDLQQKYPGTVYIEMMSTSINGSPNAPIRNVGTFLDVGSTSHAVLLLPLADALGVQGPQAYFPMMRSITLNIYPSDRASDVISLSEIKFDDEGNLPAGYHLTVVGLALHQHAPLMLPGFAQQKVAGLMNKVQSEFLHPSPLMNGQINLRNQYTSYVLLAIPVSHHINLPQFALGTDRGGFAAPLPESGLRPTEAEMASEGGRLELVGFGAISEMPAAESLLESNIKVSEVTQRNFAEVTPLNIREKTPLRQLTGERVAQEIWEVSGSGLCRSADGRSYDTGAAVYFTPAGGNRSQFVGFGVRSSQISNSFLGIAECDQVSPDDMATMVVTPGLDALSRIKMLVSAR